MLINLTALTISKRIPKWVNQKAFLSSFSCSNNLLKKQEPDHESPSISGFEATLRNKLCPNNLIRVLDSTHDLNSAMTIFKWAALQKRFSHTVDTYYWMILKLGLAGNVDELEGFCLNMVKDKCSGAEQAFVSLIQEFVKHSRLNEAVRVLAHMNSGSFKASVDVFNLVLGALVKNKHDFKDVLFIYKEMVKAGILPTVDTLNCLLEILFESGHVESAVDQFRRMTKKCCHPNCRTFEIVITGLIENNRVDDSVIILHEMFGHGCMPELSFHNFVIPRFCRQNKLEEIVTLFKMSRDSNVVLDSLVCKELVRCLCKNNRLDDAYTILQEMMEIGLTSAIDILADLVHGFCKVGKFDEALNLLEEIPGDMTSPYNALLEEYCNAGNFFRAKSLLKSLSVRGLANCDSWNVLISWICENVGIRKANELLGKMIISSISPDSATYSALVIGNCKLGKYETALELFEEATEDIRYMTPTSGFSLQSSSFNSLIKGLSDAGKADKAIKVINFACSCGTTFTDLTYFTIMRVLFKSKRARDLFIVFSLLLVEGYSIGTEEYCILIQSTIAENRIRDCALFFNFMISEGLLPDLETLRDLLSYLASRLKLHTILRAVDKLMYGNEILNSSMFNLLINGLWKEGCESEARRILDFMLEKGWVPDSTTHQVLIGSIHTETGAFCCENSTMLDNVGDILAERLGNI